VTCARGGHKVAAVTHVTDVQTVATDGQSYRLAALIATPEWHHRAACRGLDPQLFFPQPGESTVEAEAVCRSCSVSRECLDEAIAIGEPNGIWGGMSGRARRRLRSARRTELQNIR